MPDINEYLERYRENVGEMEQLARAIMRVAFPDAPEQMVQSGGVVVNTSAPAANVDAVAEIKRYKDLLEQGIKNSKQRKVSYSVYKGGVEAT